MIINIFIPYLIWKYLVKPKVEEPEFISTFRFAIALTLVPLYVLIISIIVGKVFSVIIGFYYLLASLIFALMAVKL